MDLFGNDDSIKKRSGNPFHNRKGRFSDKKTAAMEKAIKRAEVSENKLEYITSCYLGQSKEYSRILRENEDLKTELNFYKSKTA